MKTLALRTPDAQRIAPGTFVLPLDRLKAGEAGPRGPSFGDDHWDLSLGIPQTNLSRYNYVIDFKKISASLRSSAKAYAWCALHHDALVAKGALPVTVSGGLRLRAIPPARVKKELLKILVYWEFLQERGVPFEEGTATLGDHEAWVARHRNQSWSSRFRAFAGPARAEAYRPWMEQSSAHESDVWQGVEVRDLIGVPDLRRVNSTRRVPRDIMDPLLRWALFFLEEGFDDLLADLTSRKTRRRQAGTATLPGTSTTWVDHRLPHFNPELMIVSSCYIVVAYLSGMRDGEIQALLPACMSVRATPFGERYLVHGTTFKTASGYPEARTWVVLPEVHKALNRLVELRAATGERWSRETPLADEHLLFRRYSEARLKHAALGPAICYWLERFQGIVQALAKEAEARTSSSNDALTLRALYGIPLSDNQRPWKWQTRHFRRTIAWYVANEPYGIVAGKRQFGHVREVTFEGYAGSPEAGFRDDVERARRVGQQMDVVEMYEHVKAGGSLGGRRGESLTSEIRTGLAGKVVDENRILRMLKNAAKQLHAGVVNDCFFDADRALCLKGTAERATPKFGRCEWSKCPNSCITPKHAPMLSRARDDAVAHRRVPGLAKPQRVALDNQIKLYEHALAALK